MNNQQREQGARRQMYSQQPPPDHRSNPQNGTNGFGGAHYLASNVMQPSAFAPSRQYVPSTGLGTAAQAARVQTAESDQVQRTNGHPNILPGVVPGQPAAIVRTPPQTPQTPKTPKTSKPPGRLAFIDSLPEHAFRMPQSPGQQLNFTLVEILAFLPHWYKHPHFAQRFINNGLESRIHIAILQDHRNLNLSAGELSRAVAGLSDVYRKTMRTLDDPQWTRATHRVDAHWNIQLLDVSGFVPDHARITAETYPASIPFGDLLKGLIKMPDPDDAGDLTRAISCVIKELKQGVNNNYMFPKDIHTILRKHGYAAIQQHQYDRAVVARYAKKVRNATTKRYNDHGDGQYNGTPAPAAPPAKRVKVQPQTPQQQQAHLYDPRYTQHLQQPTPQTPQHLEHVSDPRLGLGQYQQAPQQPVQQQFQNPYAGNGQAQVQYGHLAQSPIPQMPQNGYQQAAQQQMSQHFDPRDYGVQQPGMKAATQIPPVPQHRRPQDFYASAFEAPVPPTPHGQPSHANTLRQDEVREGSPHTSSSERDPSPASEAENEEEGDEDAEAEANALRFLNGPPATLHPVKPTENDFAPSQEPQSGTLDGASTFYTNWDQIQNLPNIPPEHHAAIAHAWRAIEAEATKRGISTLEALAFPIDLFGIPTPQPEPAVAAGAGEDKGDEDLMAGVPFNNTTQYPDDTLLRECVEADDAGDNSDLARAAR